MSLRSDCSTETTQERCSFYLRISESSVHAGLVRQLDISGIRTVCQRQLLNLTVDRQHSRVVWVPLQGPPLVAHFPPVKLHVLEVPDLPQQFQISIQNMGLWGIFEGRTPRLWWERFIGTCLPLSPHRDAVVRWHLWRTGLHQTPNLPQPCSWTSQPLELWTIKLICLQITLPKTGIFVTATQSLKTHL